MAWREEGVLTSAIADRLGCQRSSVKRLLAKQKALPKDVIPERKKGSGRPAMIKSHTMKVLERSIRKNPRSMARIVKQEVPEVACLTVRNINHLNLKRLKIPSRLAAQKPLLMKKINEDKESSYKVQALDRKRMEQGHVL